MANDIVSKLYLSWFPSCPSNNYFEVRAAQISFWWCSRGARTVCRCMRRRARTIGRVLCTTLTRCACAESALAPCAEPSPWLSLLPSTRSSVLCMCILEAVIHDLYNLKLCIICISFNYSVELMRQWLK